MAIKNIAGNCLIRIPIAALPGMAKRDLRDRWARARLETMKPLLVGKDPLTIEGHFHNLTTVECRKYMSTAVIGGIQPQLQANVTPRSLPDVGPSGVYLISTLR
jgi:hypothetical protein